jgi:hypothetical protein
VNLQAVGTEGNEDVGLDALLALIVNGADRQVAFDVFERFFDLGELGVEFPKFYRHLFAQIDRQEVTAFAPARSFALGGNARDQVVGMVVSHLIERQVSVPQFLDPRQVAFVYGEGLIVNLTDLIRTDAKNYRLDAAAAINDKGQIVGIAFDNSAGAFRAVSLTPLSP